MKKNILVLFVIFFQTFVKAQLDLEHWFPPVFNTGAKIYSASISLTTDKIAPFKVYIYNYNTLLDTVTLSKSDPVEYQLKDIENVFDGDPAYAMKPINRGIHLVGENSFYANLKLDGNNTEIISSKGKSALGTLFFVVNDQTILNGHPDPYLENYQASITAYHDNTHITIKNYSKGLVFTNGFKGDEIDIILNKNQSYVVAAQFRDNMKYDIDQFNPNLIGAQITSDKSIAVTNGNSLSQDIGVTLYETGSVNIDQSLPVNKLGKEYFLINGMGDGDFKMEKALIVATEDNTQIFFNDDKTPFITLNKGNHFTGPINASKSVFGNEESFTNEDGRVVRTSGTFIRSSKAIYCYQLIATFHDKGFHGAFDQSLISSAMLLAYPLDIDYQVKSIQLAQVDVIGTDDFRRSKVSIKSESDANVLVNGIMLNGGSPIKGKPGWKYNTIIGSTGNLNIESNKSLNVDFVAGGRPDKIATFPPIVSGYAASVVSFSNDPVLKVSGNCLEEGIILSINKSDFDSVAWYKDGVPVLNANDYTFIPTEEGIYTCVVTYSDVQYTTTSFKVIHCPYIVVEKDFGKTCDNLVINPVFSSPNESEAIIKLEVLTQPFSGKVTADKFSLNYTPTAGFTGTDRFVYRICSASGLCETVKADVTVNKKPVAEINSNLNPKSSSSNGNIIYDLTEAIIDKGINIYDFFEDVNLTKPILDPANYATAATIAYVKISDPSGCFITKEINLLFSEDVDLPNAFSPNGDGINDFWDFSKLRAYEGVELSIYNKYGQKVFDFKDLNKGYQWSGKDFSGRTFKTDTYWAIIKWNNSKTGNQIVKNMYILLKARN